MKITICIYSSEDNVRCTLACAAHYSLISASINPSISNQEKKFNESYFAYEFLLMVSMGEETDNPQERISTTNTLPTPSLRKGMLTVSLRTVTWSEMSCSCSFSFFLWTEKTHWSVLQPSKQYIQNAQEVKQREPAMYHPSAQPHGHDGNH